MYPHWINNAIPDLLMKRTKKFDRYKCMEEPSDDLLDVDQEDAQVDNFRKLFEFYLIGMMLSNIMIVAEITFSLLKRIVKQFN